jgi:PAS domain S-box-containing protein
LGWRHSTPLSQPDGSILWHGFITDITARRQAEESLRQSEAMYRAVVESQTDLICRFRPDGTLTFVNAAYCRYHGEARDALLGSDFVARVAPEDRALARAHLDSFGAHKPSPASNTGRSLPAARCAGSTGSTARSLTTRAICGIPIGGRDITERKQAEEALERRVTQLACSTTSARSLPFPTDRVLNGLRT